MRLTPLHCSLFVLSDVPLKHSIYFLHQITSNLLDATANFFKHQVALQARGLAQKRKNPKGLQSNHHVLWSHNSMQGYTVPASLSIQYFTAFFCNVRDTAKLRLQPYLR